MGTLLDASLKEDRVEVIFSGFYQLIRESASAELMKNVASYNVPRHYIREMVTGVSEETGMRSNDEGGKEYVNTDTE